MARGEVTTISRGRSRLWPSGLQYNTRHTRIAWPSISQGTGIVAAGFSAICARQLTQIRKESSQLLHALIMWFAGRDQHMQLHHRECCSMSRKAKSSFSAWFLLPDHLIRSLTPPCSRTTWATKRLSTANMSTRAAPASSRQRALATTTWQSLPLTTCRQ